MKLNRKIANRLQGRRLSGGLFALVLAVALGMSACSGADASTSEVATGSGHHDMQILVGMRVCQLRDQDPRKDLGQGREADNCDSVPVPYAAVTITSRGQELWSGQADSFGRARAEFEALAEWTIKASSPLLVSDIVRPGNPVDPTLEGTTVESNEVYALEVAKK